MVCAAAVATPAGVLLGRHDVHSSAGARCVTTTRASVMGAATFRYCDQDAVAYCRRAAPADERVASQCRELGLRP